MNRLLIALPALVVAASAAFAGPIEDREAIMKGFGDAMKTLVPIAKGEAAFDAATVAAGLAAINDGAQKIDVAALFPAGSDQGDTEASPKIWENLADFTARVDKLKADAAAGAAAKPADAEAFKAVFGAVAGNCGSCHETYRLKKG